MFFTAKHHFCPRGMTIGVKGEPRGETEEAKKCFYISGVYPFTEEHRATVLDYFKTCKSELYEKYMDGVEFYLGGI